MVHPFDGTEFPPESDTLYTLVSVSYSRISQNISSAPSLGTDDGKRYFCYIDDNNDIKAMNHGDMLDSLVRPVIDEIVSGSTGANQIRLFYKFKFINRRK